MQRLCQRKERGAADKGKKRQITAATAVQTTNSSPSGNIAMQSNSNNLAKLVDIMLVYHQYQRS